MNLDNIELEVEAAGGYPDFADSYLKRGNYIDTGIELTNEELDFIQDNHPDLVYELALKQYF